MSTQITTSIPLAQQVIANCEEHGLNHIVISPGSRNAPLTIGFTNNSFFKCYSVVDERCAAFFALGIAQQTQKPVVLVCTSGSALLNYYPAIAEAFYSDIPLVILSADRPKEHIDIGDGQTIRQEHVFANHILFEANLNNEIDYSEQLSSLNKQKITTALNKAKEEFGPVHINIPLYEPLYETVISDHKVRKSLQTNDYKDSFVLEDTFIKKWNNSAKKLVLVGVLSPNSLDNNALSQLMKDPSVLLFTETTSNLHHPKAVHGIDQLISKLSDTQFKDLQPDLLLTFGGLVVSKRIKAFLRKYSPQNHWHVDTKKAYDTFVCLSDHFKTPIQYFLESLFLNSKTNAEVNYQKKWLDIYNDKLKKYDSYVASAPYSDLKVFDSIIRKLPKKLHLQLSNSSTIRYTQLFKLPEGVEVFCNRGTSGIDGSTSTAIGAAIVQNKATVLITGDLSFLYDSNAMWNSYIPENFKVIIINNNGGGIFRILPGDKEAEYFSTYLETTHNYKAQQLAKMYGFSYQYADENTLSSSLNTFFKSNKKEILEIETPRMVNNRVLLDYFC